MNKDIKDNKLEIEEIHNQHNENRDCGKHKKHKGKGWWYGTAMAVIHALGVGAIVGLSVALYFSQDKITTQVTYQNQMESVYSKAYYNLLDDVNDIDSTLAKLSVAKTRAKQESLLYDVWCSSVLAEEYLSTFENQDEGVRTAVKFVNQLGDYSLHLAGKLAKGEDLTEKEMKTLMKMRPMTATLRASLEKINGDLVDGKMFIEENGVLQNFSKAFSPFTKPDFEYPEMIYDGPFSDGLETMSAKGLEGLEEIDKEKGKAIIEKLFEGATDIEYIGRFNGRIKTDNYTFTHKGLPAYIQLSVKGGKVVNYTLSATSESDAGVVKNAGEKAVAFAKKLGYENLQVVWTATSHGHTYINLAPVVDGIILYPDLVKVKIDDESGLITGFDSTHHAYNHRKRVFEKPTIAEDKARENLSYEPIAVGKLALIPEGGQKETLCYEYQCDHDGTYFIYIDAMTGAETEILYVIDDVNEGQSLI